LHASLVARGVFKEDAAQLPIVRSLERLSRVVFGSGQARGLYVYGEVGTGKTALMDVFFQSACPRGTTTRVHFHDFLLRLHGRRRKPAFDVGAALAAEAKVLCLDEFQITDFADGLLLRQLFDGFWARGGVLVATSNRKPEDLYEGGPNRRYLEPLISNLRRYCVVRHLRSARDHRRERGTAESRGLGEKTKRFRWSSNSTPSFLKEGSTTTTKEGDDWRGDVVRESFAGVNVSWTRDVGIAVGQGRTTTVPLVATASDGRRCACFDFAALCGADVGAADYAAIAGAFGQVLLDGVPRLTLKDHDHARRFITLVDCLYEARCVLFLAADDAASPDDLFAGHEGIFEPSLAETDGVADLVSVRELAWAFRRAASRLVEMDATTWPPGEID